MNRVNVEFEGPVMENLCRITVGDDHDRGDLHLDNAEVEEARAEGPESLLELLLDNADSRIVDILEAADLNGSPVIFDGGNLDPEILSRRLNPVKATP